MSSKSYTAPPIFQKQSSIMFPKSMPIQPDVALLNNCFNQNSPASTICSKSTPLGSINTNALIRPL